MVKKRRQRPLPIPPRPRRRPWSRDFRRQVAVVSAFVLLLVIIGGVIGFALLQDWYEENVQRPNSTAVQVGETSLDLDYFGRRLKLLVAQLGLQGQPDQASLAASLLVNSLEREELLRGRAAVDLGLSVSPEEIDWEIASGLNVSGEDPQAFEIAYQAELNGADLSDEEYRAMTEGNILSRKVQEVFSLSVPETVEQVRIRQILVGTADEGYSVLERLDAGEDFGDLARELSLDTDTKEEGGERGWLARDELDISHAVQAFALEVGTPSQPIVGPGGYYIFEVQERQADREVTPEQQSTISSSYFTFWLSEQRTLFALPDIQPVLQDAGKFQWAAEKAFGL